LLLTSKQTLRDILEDAVLSGFQVAIHAIGDKGNQLALDEIEWSYSSVGGKELRHRVEHAQVVDLEDIPRFKLLNVIPSMQPTHATSDMNMAEDRIGAERLKGAYAWRTFIDQGSRLASGSDFPIELANPFYGIHAAVTRQNRQNLPIKGWISEQSISITEAIRSFTIDAAWAAHQETTLGSLEVGKWADFIIVDRDIFNEPQESIWKTEVLQTWIAGAVVYQKF
jgi:predicted amidohydrolase YtcJ